MKNKSKRIRKVTFTAAAVPVMAVIFAVSVFAAVLFHSLVTGKGSISSGNMGDINMEVTGTVSGEAISSGQSSFTLKKAGDRVSFSVSIENKSGQDLIHSGSLALTSLTQNGTELTVGTDKYNALRSCILVYCDGAFVDSLAHLVQSGTYEFIKDSPVPENGTDKHELTFELHAAATQYSNVGFEITVTDKALNADAKRYIFVKNKDEFTKAIDDINSGLLTYENGDLLTPKIIIADDILLSKNYTVKNPLYIDLHGNNLSGGTLELYADAAIISSQPISSAPTSPVKTVLNSSDAALEIYDFYHSDAYANEVTIKAFSEDKVFKLVTERAEANLSNGVANGGSADALTSLSFYADKISLTVNGDGCSLNGSVISSAARSATDVGTLIVSVGSNIKTIDFKQYGDDGETVLAAIRNGELAHIEALTSSADVVMSDVFLPSEIKKYGASIEWISASPNVISADGRIIDDSADREVVTLYANVRINEKVYQLTYSFTVSGINNEIRFSNFIAQLSPLHLKEVWRGDTNISSADFIKSHQFLPIVNVASDYHYLKAFTSPDPTLTSAKLVWDGYEDVGLEYLTYSQDATYNYVSVYTSASGEQAVYLNTPVFSTFAQINLSAKFVGDDTVYTGAVNIIIEPGNYEELLDEVFLFIQGQFDATDIYKNVVKSRMELGMKDESGDFIIDAKYVISSSSLSSDKYSITLDAGVSGGVITATPNMDSDGKVTSYNIAVDLTKATQVESRVPVSVTVKYTYQPEVTSTRTLYVNVPAVIKPDENGFSNYSVFSSVKYQLFGYLPIEEQVKSDDAFTISDGKITNHTGAYILIKDIDRCTGDGGTFSNGTYAGEPLTINNGDKLDKLYFLIGKASSDNAKEEKVYGLLQLIQWATGSENGNKTVTVGGTTYTMPADGKQYLTPDEITVLRSYYNTVTDSSDFDTLFNSVSTYPTANGTKSRVVSDSKAFGDAIKNLTSDATVYFKYTELMRWALNEQNFPKSAFFGNDYPIGNPPNGGSLSWGSYTVANGVTYTIRQNSGNYSLLNGYFNEDDTEYISEREEVVLQAFWNGAGQLSGFKTAFAAYTVTPTYLEQDAVQVLVGAVYKALGYTDFSEELISYNGENVPAITSADGALEGITYFKNLVELVIKGDSTENGSTINAGLPAFLHTDSLATFYNRLTSSDMAANLEKLVLYNCAQDYVTFELDGISAFGSLTYLDLGMNYGLKTLGAALDITSSDVAYLDLSGADSADKYSSYPLSVLSGRIADVYYTTDSDRNGKTATKVKYTGKTDGSLAYLRELEKIDGQYMQLQQGITLTTSTQKARLFWQIDNGNPIYPSPVTKAGVFTQGTYGTYSTPAEMIGELTNYYYGSDGILYAISYSATSGTFRLVNSGVSVRSLAELADADRAELAGQLTGNISYSLVLAQLSETELQPDLTSYTDVVVYNKNNSYYVSTDGENPLSQTTYRHIYKRSATKTITYSFSYKGSDLATKTFMAYLADSKSVVEYTYSYGKSGEVTGTITLKVNTYVYYGNNSNSTNSTDEPFDLGSASTIYWGTRSWWSYSFSNSQSIDSSYQLEGTYSGVLLDVAVTDNSESSIKQAILNQWESVMQTDVQSKINSSIDYTETLAKQTTIAMFVPYLADETDKTAAISRLENIANGVQQFDGEFSVYLYSGTNGSADYITTSFNATGNQTNSKTYSFVRNKFYRLVWQDGALTWEDTNVSAANPTSTEATMESILAEANAEKGEVTRGNWLGLYVWYSGTGESYDTLTVNGRTYEKGWVYRIVWADEAHTEFTYEKYRICTSVNGTEFASKPLSASEEGAIYYLTAATNFYAADKFYVMTYDDIGGFWYLNRFGDATPLLDRKNDSITAKTANSGFLRIKNEKLYITTEEDYSGTGGTKYVDISAVVVIDGTEYKRTFRVEVVG